MKLVILFLVFMALLLLWIAIEQKLLLVRRQEIRLVGLPAAFDNKTILQLSDLHHRKMGKENCRLWQKARQLQPDWIVITGDLVSRDESDFSHTKELLRQLAQIAPVYLCEGNHELDMSLQRKTMLEQVIQETGCTLLKNETISLSKSAEQPLYLAGASLKRTIYRDENNGFRHLESYTYGELQSDLGEKSGCTILLAHNPLLMDTYADWGADLVLSGHVHGGMVRIPGIGGILSPERKFFPRYSKGLYHKKNTQMYISGGIGKLRVCNPPEITILQLRNL